MSSHATRERQLAETAATGMTPPLATRQHQQGKNCELLIPYLKMSNFDNPKLALHFGI